MGVEGFRVEGRNNIAIRAGSGLTERFHNISHPGIAVVVSVLLVDNRVQKNDVMGNMQPQDGPN